MINYLESISGVVNTNTAKACNTLLSAKYSKPTTDYARGCLSEIFTCWIKARRIIAKESCFSQYKKWCRIAEDHCKIYLKTRMHSELARQQQPNHWKVSCFTQMNILFSTEFDNKTRQYLNKAEAMVTPRRKCRRPAMVTPKSYPYP